MLYCPNYTCQTPNAETNRYCQTCRTPLPKRYLWAVGEQATAYRPGELLANRYLCKRDRIFLDTKPGLFASESLEVPPPLLPYLKLSPYQLHIPQIYDLVRLNPAGGDVVGLLDQPALSIPTIGSDPNPFDPDGSDGPPLDLLPMLQAAWSTASALRQLNWLWQLAHLWQPCRAESVGISLLTPELLRVEGPIVRLLEVHLDGVTPPGLVELGQSWLPLAERSHPTIRPALMALCQQWEEEEWRTAEQVVESLDQLLVSVGRSHPRQIHLATRTDQGPSRQRNEDACYPPNGTIASQPSPPGLSPSTTLVIVCDGIGGHQGGDVASHLAIDTIDHKLQALPLATLDAVTLGLELEKAACAANDVISQRNDSERRFERQRMGTTLVVALVRGHELYLAHVGDSRAYWITRYGCHQITQDDDVASREVRLGYNFHRDALQQPSAGSLVQALGMAASTMLHPTVQRFILDEDSVFLLCSDGLSDHDRVEDLWDLEVLPIVLGKTDVAIASQRLVDCANTLNGHDNVTVGLLHVQVEPSSAPDQVIPAPQPQAHSTQGATLVVSRKAASARSSATAPTAPTTQPITQPPKTPPPPISQLLFSIALLLGIGGIMAYFLFLGFRNRLSTVGERSPTPTPTVPVTPPPIDATPPGSGSSVLPGLRAPSFIQVVGSSSPPDSALSPPLVLQQQTPQAQSLDPTSALLPEDVGIVAGGSVVYVAKRIRVADEVWVQLQVCSAGVDAAAPPSPPLDQSPDQAIAPESPPTPLRTLQAGDSGWAREVDVVAIGNPSPIELSPDQQVQCTDPDPSAPPQISQLTLNLAWLGQ